MKLARMGIIGSRMIVFCVVVGLSGCMTGVKTGFDESITDYYDSEGNVVSTTTTTSHNAKATAAPFGKLEQGATAFDYRWGGDENQITSGLGAKNVDNTGQIEAMGQLMGLVGQLVSAGLIGNNGGSQSAEDQPTMQQLIQTMAVMQGDIRSLVGVMRGFGLEIPSIRSAPE